MYMVTFAIYYRGYTTCCSDIERLTVSKVVFQDERQHKRSTGQPYTSTRIACRPLRKTISQNHKYGSSQSNQNEETAIWRKHVLAQEIGQTSEERLPSQGWR